jgi:hypothetical protein
MVFVEGCAFGELWPMAQRADPVNLDAFLPAVVLLLQNVVESMGDTSDVVVASSPATRVYCPT